MLDPRLNPETEPTVLFVKPTTYRTVMNRYRLFCSTCGDLYFVDEETFCMATSAVQKGLDNPFRCDDCQEGFEWNFAE